VKSPEEVKPWFLRDTAGFPLIPEMNPLPSEAIFDKISMSAFEGTPLDMALRDCGIDAFAIVGIAMEIGIEPTVRHGADLGYIPVVVKDACGFGHCDAAERSVVSLELRAMLSLRTQKQSALRLDAYKMRDSQALIPTPSRRHGPDLDHPQQGRARAVL